MNKKLKNQIKTYVGVAGALLVGDNASGQVVYHDISPDTLIDGAPVNSGTHNYLLDIDNDGDNDLSFFVSYHVNGLQTQQFVRIKLLDSIAIANEMEYVDFGGQPYDKPVPMENNAGEAICYPQMSYWVQLYIQGLIVKWAGGSNSFGYGRWSHYNSEHFLAFRLLKTSGFNYGWIRLKTLSPHSVIIQDYAYNTIPNACIIAGDTTNSSVGLPELNNGFQIVQQNNIIKILSHQRLNNIIISVYDLLGEKIITKNFSATEAEITIDKKGINFVEVKSEKGIFRKKIFIY